AVIESTTASALRLVWIEASWEARMPVTTSSPTVLGAASAARAEWAAANASRLAEAIIMLLRRVITRLLPLSPGCPRSPVHAQCDTNRRVAAFSHRGCGAGLCRVSEF